MLDTYLVAANRTRFVHCYMTTLLPTVKPIGRGREQPRIRASSSGRSAIETRCGRPALILEEIESRPDIHIEDVQTIRHGYQVY